MSEQGNEDWLLEQLGMVAREYNKFSLAVADRQRAMPLGPKLALNAIMIAHHRAMIEYLRGTLASVPPEVRQHLPKVEEAAFRRCVVVPGASDVHTASVTVGKG